MKTRFGKKIVALVGAIAVVLSLLPAALPAMAESGGQEPAARGAANAPLVAQSGTATPENALDDWKYKDFGIPYLPSLPDREAFTSDEQPLKGFEGTAMSRLFVGYMNKSKAQQGSYAVFDTMPARSAQGATISGSGAAGYLDASPVSAPAEYASLRVDNSKYRTLNTVSLDMGTNADGSGGIPPVICEAVLLTGREKGVANAKNTSWLGVVTLVKKGNGYVPQSTSYTKLANSNTRIGEIDVRAAQGLNAVCAGDYDGDGIDELAVYVPRFDNPYIQVYDIGINGDIAEGSRIPLNDLHTDNDWAQYNFAFSGWNLPIVNLGTSDLARADGGTRDHLVVSACLPRSDAESYKGHSQLPALAVYEQDGSAMKRLFFDHLDYGDYYMRFPATVEADVNGNGTGELVVAGYADTWTDTKKQKLKDHPFQKYCVNLLTWDKDADAYRMAYTKPMEYTPTGSVKKAMAADSAYAMSEPVALTAAALSEETDNDYLLLEGAVLSFSATNNAQKADGEQMQLVGGKLTGTFEMRMNPQTVTVSHAVSGRFAADHAGSEQIALVWNDNYSRPGAVVDGSITWLWMENNVVTQHDTNTQYLKTRSASRNGTFLSLARVEDTEHRANYKYMEKSYGWSAPDALMALPAAPYWKELPYENGVGDVTFSVSNTYELPPPAGESMNYSVGSTGSLTAMAGAGALGSEALAGFSTDLNGTLAASGELQDRLSNRNTQTFRVPGNENHVLVYATPIVTYKYKVWLPAFRVTEETAKKYKELTNSDTLKNENGTVYDVGDTVPAGWYSYNIHVPYSPTYSLIPMDQYNEAYKRHNLSTDKLDMSAYDFTVGDPSTYQRGFSDIAHYDSAENMVSSPKNIAAGGADSQIDFPGAAGIEWDGTVGIQVSDSVQAGITGQVQFLGSEKTGLSDGFAESRGANINMRAGFNFDIGGGASVNNPPSGYGDYNYQTTMGVWPYAGHGALLTTGYIATTTKPDAPPKPPDAPYIYETGTQKDGKAFLVLAWDQPAASDYRLADEYEVLYKETSAPVTSYQLAGKVNVLEENFMLITDLKRGKLYDLAFRPLLANGRAGGISSPLVATTVGDPTTLSFDPAYPKDAFGTPSPSGMVGPFSIEVKDKNDTNANNSVTFQWQTYQPGEGYVGEWVSDKAGGAPALTTYGTPGTRFRCIVTTVPNPNNPNIDPYSAMVQHVITRTATVYAGNASDLRYSVALTAQLANGDELPSQSSVAYFLQAGRAVKLKAEVAKSDTSSVNSGTVSLYYRMDGGTETPIATGLAPVNGVVEQAWTPTENGQYNIVAIYTAPGSTLASGIAADAPTGQTAGPTGGPTTTPAQAPDETPTGGPTASPAPTEVPSAAPEGQQTPAPEPEVPNTGENTAGPASLSVQGVETMALSAVEGTAEPTPPEPSETPTTEPSATPTTEPSATPTPGPSAAAAVEPQAGTNATGFVPDANNAMADITINVGNIKNKVYPLKYMLYGGENSPANQHAIGIDAAPLILSKPTLEGATFDSWREDSGFLTGWVKYLDPGRPRIWEADYGTTFTLYAKWNATEHKISYDLDGGTNHPDNPDKYTLLDGLALREPEKPGYRFMGWYFESSSPSADVDNTKPVYYLPLLDKKGDWVDADVTLRAKWEAIEYPITYHTPFADGKGANPDTYTVEDTVVLNPADYTDSSLSLRGWYTDAECTKPITQIAAGTTTGPLSLYAKPEFADGFVYFHPLGGVYGGENPYSDTDGSTLTLEPASRQGFDFHTWSSQAKTVNGEQVADTGNPGSTYDAGASFALDQAVRTLYAAWKPAAGQVELHWLDPLDDEEVYQNYGVKGQKIADPGVTPDHYGYAFDGKWYRDKALTQQWNFGSDTVPTNLTGGGFTLYAGLREMYYNVSFEPNGGTAVPAQQGQEGKTVAKPADPALQDKMFLGWYEDDALTIPYDFASEVQSDLTLYAKWRPRGPVKPAPGDSKILGIEDGKTYAHGSTFEFTAVGAGMDNDHPIEGDERHVPKSWSVNPSGTWSGPPYTASFETKDMAMGAHTLTVTFALERYESGAWKDTNDTVQAQVTFTLAKDAPERGVRTGDETLPVWIWLAIAAAAAVCLVFLGRKLLKRQ